MKFPKRLSHAFYGMAITRQFESTLRRVRTALAFLIATLILSFLSLLIIAAYFLIHLIQGR
jgi:hypothetical protein